MKKAILTKNAPAPIGPYSQAIEIGGLIFCSGQIPMDPATNEIKLGDIRLQAELVMKNVGALLEAAGLGFQNVVKTTIFLTDLKDFATVNEVYGKNFKETPPARSTVQVAALPRGAGVEVEVIAHR